MGEGGVAVVVPGETVFASAVMYVEERNAIDRFRKTVVVGDEARLCEKAGDKVRWERGEGKFSHVVVSSTWGVGEGEYGVCQGGCDESSTGIVFNRLYVDNQQLRSRELSPGGIPR